MIIFKNNDLKKGFIYSGKPKGRSLLIANSLSKSRKIIFSMNHFKAALYVKNVWQGI